MAKDCVDGNYLGAYSRFFTEFIANVNPDDQLPVKTSTYNVTESELVGEIVNVALQYLNQTYCPSSLQSYIVHLVVQATKSLCKEQPEICKTEYQINTYEPLKLMKAITHEVNKICRRYLDNSRLALLPPPPSTPFPHVNVNVTKNARRKMEDRHAIILDMHTIFDIKDDSIANYYAVFDGHAGQDASTYSATHLHQYLAESVHYPKSPEEALRDAFLTTDKEFSAKSKVQNLKGGTTAVCALLLNKKLYIGWVGDSMAALVKRDGVTQLVNPHKPTREDERERIHENGGIVTNHFGAWRVNGMLNISRAIGDVQCKPYISSEPEVRCISLDGTEHFLIIACDGLWDFVDERTAAVQVYEEIFKNPHDSHAASVLVQGAKRAGSKDNITVIVVFLTPPIEIVSKSLNVHPVLPHALLNNMDSNNPFLSNLNGQFDVNVLKQQQQFDADLQAENGAGLGLNDNHMMYEKSSNGKYVADNGDGNIEYDYGDLGPETDVDAVDDVPDLRTSRDRLSRELFPDEKRKLTNEDDDKKNNLNRDDDLNNFTTCILRHEDVYSADKILRQDNNICIDNNARVETDIPVDNDEAPTSPLATKPLQHALIPEADNVADSEDSEDEWNYYRVDPNKEDPAKAIVDESQSNENRNIRENPELGVENNTEIQSSEGKNDIKCERSKENTSFELINSNISAESKVNESEQGYVCLDQEEKYQEEDMEFHLNPDAAEFVPVSPSMLRNNNNKRNFSEDYPISGSPLKQTLVMDDIPVPSESEFEKEVSQRPRDIDEKDFTNGEYVGNAAYNVNNDNTVSLDESENLSTKVQIGDDSIARIAATELRSTVPQWDANMANDSESDVQEYNIATDPMAMSLTPGDFEVAFEKGVDLNALHDLSEGDDDNDAFAKGSALPPHSLELCMKDERPHTPVSDDKPNDFTSSTPYPHEKSSQQDESNTNGFSAVEVEKQLSSTEQIEDHSSMEYETDKQQIIRLSDDDELQIKNESGLVNISQLETLKLADSPTLIASGSPEGGSMLSAEREFFGLPADMPTLGNFVCPTNLLSNANDVLQSSLNSNGSAIAQNVEDTISTEPFVTKVETLPKQQMQTDLLELMSTETATTLPKEVEPKTFQILSTQQAEDQFPFSDIESERIVRLSPTGLEETTKNVELVQNFVIPQDEKMCDFETNKIITMGSDITLDNTLNSSDSTQEFIIVEEQLQRENQTLLKNISAAEILATNNMSAEVMSSGVKEISEKTLASNDVALNKEETEPRKTTTTTVTASSSTKAKVAAKRPTKTTTITTKATTKSSPTSPSKSVSTTVRTSATTTQSTAAKRTISNTTSRPKNLDGSAKTTAVSSTTGKSTVTKTASVPKTTCAPTTTRTTTLRTGNDITKPKATTVPPKSAIGASEKKVSTTNGDVKSTNRLQTNFKPTSKATTSSTTAKGTSVKTATTTKVSTSTVTSKPRPMSAAAAIKTSVTASKSATGSISAARPKTAPISSSTSRSRDTAKTTTKSPMIDKQIKETANKQISLARAGASTVSKTGRTSAPATLTSTGTTKSRVTSTTKSLNVSATSPTKKVISKVSTGMKTTTTTSKTKVLQNGVTKNTEIMNAIITTTNNEIQDDIPRKDTSPVVVPTDNQLLLTAD